MTLSMYDVSVLTFVRQLEALSVVLGKGAAFADAKGTDPSALIEGRLAPDMFALARQVQIATQMAGGAAALLAGVEPPKFADEETTFAQLQERIAKTVTLLKSLPEEAIEASEDRKISVKLGQNNTDFIGKPYLIGFVLPNVYFHCAMAYGILRQAGVDVGKRDFLGAF